MIERHAAAVVGHPKLEMRIRSFHCDLHLCGLGMTEDVRKGFLNNSQHSALPLIG